MVRRSYRLSGDVFILGGQISCDLIVPSPSLPYLWDVELDCRKTAVEAQGGEMNGGVE